MKKLVLVLVLVLAFSFTALANPFVDVPLNHWAYDSVQSLAAKGVIVGFPDGTFGGAKSLTRYEFAEATAKALAYVEGMDFAAAEDVAILEKLAIEFADELASLGVTVADLEATLGANSEAITALETTVAKLDTFFEPLKVTGEFRVRYNKGIVPMAPATLQDRTRLWFEAEINDNTKAGIRLQATDTLGGAGTPAYTWSAFWVDYQGEDLSIYVGEILPDVIGLGLISYYEEDADPEHEFDGFTATWTWDEEDTDLGTWTLFGDVEDYYVLHVAAALGDEDEVALGVTASYDVLAGNAFIGGADVAFGLGEDDDVSVAVEGAVFYGAALSYAVAADISGSMDDLGLTLNAWYVTPGFAPTMTDFTPDTLGGYVQATYPLTDEVTGKAKVTYEMDSAMVAAVTTKVRGTLNYVPEDAVVDEAGEVYVEYNVLAATTKARAKYLNYPLADDFVLSGLGQYTYPTADYAGAVTLVYTLADDKDLTMEGRVDSDGAILWSAEVSLAYALDTKTTLSVGFEMNDWEDDINDYDELNILDTLGTVKAELKVKF